MPWRKLTRSRGRRSARRPRKPRRKRRSRKSERGDAHPPHRHLHLRKLRGHLVIEGGIIHVPPLILERRRGCRINLRKRSILNLKSHLKRETLHLHDERDKDVHVVETNITDATAQGLIAPERGMRGMTGMILEEMSDGELPVTGKQRRGSLDPPSPPQVAPAPRPCYLIDK